MLLATQSTSVIGTQKYFETVLTQSDYYLGQEVTGHWHGQGTMILGIGKGAQVERQAFVDLLHGLHPLTGQKLTQRIRKDRRPGMDLTFSVPKSVSLAWAINDDDKIIECLQQAVHETMKRDIEPLMHRRVRKGMLAKSREKKRTGKLLYADFLHKTSRPVDGEADPHLHIHAFVMNWTEDEGTYYAAELEEIVRQRPSLQAKFEARLARLLEQLGYKVEEVRYLQSGRLKRGWELVGIARETIEKFSRRTAQIEQFAEDNGIEDASQKGKLGKRTRDRKDSGKTVKELRTQWQARLTEKERLAFTKLLQRKNEGEQRSDKLELEKAIESVQYALEHHLYRNSTLERHQLVGMALEHGISLKPEIVEQAVDSLGLIERSVLLDGTQRHLITTRSVLQAEQAMIAFARDGRGTRKAIQTTDYEFSRDWLNLHQKNAVEYLLQSRDQVMAIIGRAGTGKTALMQEAAEAIEQNGKQVFTFAPSTGAKEVLQQQGFKTAQIVEHLIRNTKLHDKLNNQLIWIDEAGLLDVRSMNKIFQIAKTQNARVVLSGDPHQHASPRRGEAMRLLEQEAGLKIARTEQIQRQRGKYKQAVDLISRGFEVVDERSGKTGLLAGFDLLDKLGKIKEISGEDRHAQLAKHYLNTTSQGKSALVVAPTHAEAQEVTKEIRSKLKSSGKLSNTEKSFTQLKSLNLSEAEKRNSQTYRNQTGLIIQFHQNDQGFNKGERYHVQGVKNGEVKLIKPGDQQEKTLPLKNSDRFEVYSQQQLRLAAGDKIRFSLGGVTNNKQSRISNGRLDQIKGFDQQGNLLLSNGWVIDKDYGHLDLGYVITSHASQGKDRHVAIAAMGSESLPAINAKQFYVTVSRGRDNVTLYVDNKAKIRKAIEQSGQQLSATELLRISPKTKREKVQVKQRSTSAFKERVSRWWKNLQQRNHSLQRGRHLQANHRRDVDFGLERSR